MTARAADPRAAKQSPSQVISTDFHSANLGPCSADEHRDERGRRREGRTTSRASTRSRTRQTAANILEYHSSYSQQSSSSQTSRVSYSNQIRSEGDASISCWTFGHFVPSDCNVSTSWWTSRVRPAGSDNEFRSQREAEQRPPVISWSQFNIGRHVYLLLLLLLLQTLRIKAWMFDKIQTQQNVNNTVNVINQMWTRHKLLTGTSEHVYYCFIYFFLLIFYSVLWLHAAGLLMSNDFER